MQYTTIASGTYPSETWTAPYTVGSGDFRASSQFDSAGNLHMATLMATGAIQYYQKTSGGTWIGPETVAGTSDDIDTGAGVVDSGPSLAIDKQGLPNVTWTGLDNGTGVPSLGIRVASRTVSSSRFPYQDADKLAH